MSVIHVEREQPVGPRLLVFPWILGVAFAVFFLRLWYLQVVVADDMKVRSAVLRQSEIERLAPRGLIVDRKGRLIAGVRAESILTAVPRHALADPDALARLARELDMEPQALRARVEEHTWRPYVPAPVLVGLPLPEATRVAESPDLYPGFGVESQAMRFYADAKAVAHVIGYVWTPSQADVERLSALGIAPAKYVGKTGVESIYEAHLMGAPGVEVVELDAKRRPVRTVESRPAVPGDRLILSLDLALQAIARDELAGRRGAVVCLEPRTGEVLAMLSAPSYNPAAFLQGIAPSEWRALQNDRSTPLLNRAIGSAYAPGSTFKIVTALAAMRAGVWSPTWTVACDGFFELGNRRFRCLGRHGRIAFEQAMVKSCNTYFAALAHRLGPEPMRQACAAIGLGGRTGIDLPGESRGVVPTEEWIKRWRKPPIWYGGDSVNFGIGQGELSTTPLQMACVAALVANRGVVYRPHVLQAVAPPGATEPERFEPEVLGQVRCTEQAWSALARAMVGVIETGTATPARIAGMRWAGKTGSAENSKNHEAHSWFVGFAPADQPRIAIAVVVENAGHGGDVAAPIAARLVERYLLGRGPTSNSAAPSSTSAASSSSPSSR